jgi:hypothetical protein
MATAPVAVQAWQAFGSGTSVSMTFQQTATLGNLLVTMMTKDDDVLATGPAGWTQAYGFGSGGAIAMQCWWKLSDGTETGLTITGDSEVYAVYGLELSGVDQTNPIVANAGQRVGTTDLASLSISAATSLGIPVLYIAHIGVDRNRQFLGWTNGTGIEPLEYFRHEGAGAGDVSQWVGGVFYEPNAPTVTRFQELSAADEWGTRGLYITPPLPTPIISLPTGTPATQNASSSNITGAGFTTDVAQGTAYWYLSGSATPPSTTNLKSGSGGIQNGSQTVTATGALTFGTISGLTPNTTYWLHFLHTNAIKDSNILSLDTSTPPFTLPLVFSSLSTQYYTGHLLEYYTPYQNTGTAYASMTASATPPTGAQIVANTVPGGLYRATDSSWSTSSNPNVFFSLVWAANPGTIFPNTQYWCHAVVDDPAAGAQSDVVSAPFTTRERFILDNFVVVESLIDQITFEYDLTLNESTDPRATFFLFEDNTPRDAQEMYNERATAPFYSGELTLTAADGTYQIICTGLAPLTTYYLHVFWRDAANNDYSTRVYWPVISPGPEAPTALSTEFLELRTQKAIVITDPLEYTFVRFGVPGRNVVGKTEFLTLTPSQGAVDQGRDVSGATELLEMDVSKGSVSTGSGDLLILGEVELLELTTNPATVGKGQTSNGATELLTMTVNPATVTKDRTVIGVTEQLTLEESQGVVIIARVVTGQTEQLTLTPTPATVGRGVTVRGTTELLELTVTPGDVQADREVGGTTELLELTVTPGTVGQGQTANGVTEQLTLTTNPGQIIRDRLVEQVAAVQLLVQHNKGRIGRGDDIDGVTEELVLTTYPATVKRGRRIDGNTEELVLAAYPARVDRGLRIDGQTEQLTLTTNPAIVTTTDDRRLICLTHKLVLTTETALVSQGRDVAGQTEQLVLTTSEADVDQVLRPTGAIAGLYGQDGVEIIKSPRHITVLMTRKDGVTVLTPSKTNSPHKGAC